MRRRPMGLIASLRPSTCHDCWRGRKVPGRTFKSQNTYRPNVPVSQRRTRRIISSTVGVAGISMIGYLIVSRDAESTLQYAFAAAQRTTRVISTLAVCIDDYRRTLKLVPDSNEAQPELLKACHKRCAERTLRAMERNGSIFIKLGQHLSSMSYLLPVEWTTTFVKLQDHCPVSSYESVEAMFLEDTGYTISEYFETFDMVPIGAASLAQVHTATMRGSGQRVAVKVQHPALAQWVPLDLALTKFTFSILKKFFPQYDLEWLSNEMELSLPQELDFAVEGRNASKTKAHFETLPELPLVVPDVIWASERILIMECVMGNRLDDLEYIDANNIDRDEISATLAYIFNEMIFGETPLHCDPHGGNIAIRSNSLRYKQNFDIILYDHGLYRDISIDIRRQYAKLWLAVMDADEMGMRRYAYDVAGINEEQFPLFASAITGRDYMAVTTQSVVSTRTPEEKELMSRAFGDDLLQQLVNLLSKVPRIILLILKTNDLTRSLDENLRTREGPVRNFMILAHYCSKTVFQEQMEIIRKHGSVLRPGNLARFIQAWTSLLRIELRLALYESYVSIRRFLHLSPMQVNKF